MVCDLPLSDVAALNTRLALNSRTLRRIRRTPWSNILGSDAQCIVCAVCGNTNWRIYRKVPDDIASIAIGGTRPSTTPMVSCATIGPVS